MAPFGQSARVPAGARFDIPSDDASGHKASHRPLASALHDAAQRFPNKSGFVGHRRTLSYLEFDLEAQHLALRLIGAGVGLGDRVALHMHNGPELAVGFFACFYAGAIAVPINTRLTAPEVAYVLEHSGASIYLGQPELFQEIEDIRLRCPNVRQFAVDVRDLEIQQSTATTLPAVAEDQPTVILYTSGSTARPKGAVHTHRSILNATRGFSLRRDDVAVIIAPMVHAAGFMTLLASVDTAATAVAVEHFDPDTILDALARHRGTYLLGMPVTYRALIATQRARPRDVRSGRRYLAGGDVVAPALKEAFARCFGRALHEVFGMTETGLIAANWFSRSRLDSFGCAIPGVEIDVVAANGHSVCIGTVGEMIVRAASNLIGYWNDRAAAETAIKDGWFHTGDLVRRGARDFLWFQGRKTEIIFRGGSNISPQEVEAVLFEHPAVRDAGVIGVPDPIWGERVVAFVSRHPAQAIDARELIAFAAKRLATCKTPGEIIFIDDLPKGASGKVQRGALREQWRHRFAGRDSDIALTATDSALER
jgi:long-chain acyl-CoA synthetase